MANTNTMTMPRLDGSAGGPAAPNGARFWLPFFRFLCGASA